MLLTGFFRVVSGRVDEHTLPGIIYKDTDFLVLDKPSGWSVVPGKHVGGMHLLRLLPSLQFGMEDLQGRQMSLGQNSKSFPTWPQEPPRLVHRLSTEMSGVLLLARHKAAASFAKDMVAQRSFWKRELWAVVCGRTPKSGQVSMPLALKRLGKGSVAKPVREDDGGLPALTDYSSVLYSPLAGGLTLLSMNPYSGRYHQTRAHCAFGLRAPMVGDPVYYQMSNELSTVSDFKVKCLGQATRCLCSYVPSKDAMSRKRVETSQSNSLSKPRGDVEPLDPHKKQKVQSRKTA